MVDRWLETLKAGKLLEERDMRSLCEKVTELLIEESNVTIVSSPVTVCGDIHGQFYDLLELFRQGGDVPDTSYVFMGDYVDRGRHCVETICLLLALKLRWPDKMTLLRGNHESRAVTKTYGFYEEVLRKYGNGNPWTYLTDMFDYLPLAAVIDGSVYCVHGGLSPDIRTLDQLRVLDRVQEIPNDGPFSDIMWSDPEDIDSWALSPRGAGFLFGARVTSEFNHINGLQLICRAHQMAHEGYRVMFPAKNLVTVWSAPNYCYRCGNVAAILSFDDKLERKFTIFSDVPEPEGEVERAMVPYFL
eukprot:PLAT16171.2.p2 GENE.PLAT16171.2~~PLAT16171.2.p2  ORF type:complete len:302 (-),score=122.30 PLAT16171.2:100-1005(-)